MASLSSRSSRKKIPTGKIAWRLVRRGVILGYRRPKGGAAGIWYGKYKSTRGYIQSVLGSADDLNKANDRDVLTFAQAMRAAHQVAVAGFDLIEQQQSSYSVRNATDAYITHLEAEGRTNAATTARYRVNKCVLPTLGDKECAELTARDLRAWRNELAVPNTRARRATANRTWTVLRAALNLAYQRDAIASDHAWRKVTPFKGVDAPRQRWLTVEEARVLIAACEGDFRNLVEAALHTGCRYGELAALRVEDFHHNSGTLHIRESKSGKSRDVVLTDAGSTFFHHLCKARDAAAPLLRNGNRPWRKSEQTRPMTAAVTKAGLAAISFHGLRHTWASLSVQAGVPLLVAAKNLGHSGTRMVEKHYGHLAKSYMADAIRAGAPRF